MGLQNSLLYTIGQRNTNVIGFRFNRKHHQNSNIGHILGNKIVDIPDVVETSPLGSAPITSSFST